MARLRTLTDVTVRALEREAAELHARVVVGTTLVWLVVILTVFTSALGLTRQLAESRWLTPVTTALCLLGLAALAPVVRQARLPAAFWGLTTRGWRAAVRDAIVCSLPPITILLGVKWALITWADGWAETPLLHVTHTFISSEFALLAFFPGLLWGWLYDRQRTMVGPILSHALIGLVAFEVIGVLAQSS